MAGSKEQPITSKDLSLLIDSFKGQLVADHFNLIQDTIEENKKKLGATTKHLYNLSTSRRNNTTSSSDEVMKDLLTQRKETILCTIKSLEPTDIEKDNTSFMEENSNVSSSVLLGNSFGGKNGFRPIKLPEVTKLPPYTTWIFLDRNQRMTEDQSIVGRRRIYYDQNCGEALICSDSEEEVVDDEEDKRDFGNGEDYILWKTIQQVGMPEFVLEYLSKYLERKPSEIKARYEHLLKSANNDMCVKKGEFEVNIRKEDPLMDKDLEVALDSFDNLFCRRCLVFDCRLHGCSQDLVSPAKKQFPWINSDEGAACSNNCYRLAVNSERIAAVACPISDTPDEPTHSSGSAGPPLPLGKRTSSSSVGKKKFQCSESASSNAKVASESSESEVSPHQQRTSNGQSSSPSKAKLAGKCMFHSGDTKRVPEKGIVNTRKRQKRMMVSDSDSVVVGHLWPSETKIESNSCKPNNKSSSTSQKGTAKSTFMKKSRKKELSVSDNHNADCLDPISGNHEITKKALVVDEDGSSRKEEFVDENICKPYVHDNSSWKIIEKSLYDKGLEIFGKNSCLIARNLLNGMKTCREVFQYMNFIEDKMVRGNGDGINSQPDGHNKGNEIRRRSRFLRRRGRVRRLKYTWKSAGYHSIRKRISEKKDQPCRQYNPCGCKSACGKQCPCLLNGTCCEKYCGCPKICKNRFRGCHCAKSQCRSRQCPCFAANRECDPDVCRNCWVGCGDGSFGGPSQRGDNYECRNMKLLLKQQQRVLLGRSDVSGWGAFLKNSVSKHEYLGEYTGELISHREADKRGKIYDRENSSFLFNLNDQFVLDAYRKGDKLKFANHSPVPNCYAKVIMVAGDHRVGIFAKERIGAGEELFYDYRYEPDRAPAWARKPEHASLKKDETAPSSGRAKKLA